MTTNLTLKPQFLDLSATYSADEIRQPWKDIFNEGVVGENDFLVVPKGGTAANPDAGGGSQNRSVDILANGSAWIVGDDTPATQGIYRAYHNATINETLSTNTSGSTRVDLVVLEVLDTPTNVARTRVVQGTPGAGQPATPNNCLPLAAVTCADAFTAIASGQVSDLRGRHFRQIVSATPGADVNAITGSAWTDICTLSRFVLPDARRIQVTAKAKMTSTGAGIPGVAIRIIDTDQSNAVVANTGQMKIAATGGVDEAYLSLTDSVALVSGNHTLKLQAWKNANGTVNVIKSETMSTSHTVTQLKAIL